MRGLNSNDALYFSGLTTPRYVTRLAEVFALVSLAVRLSNVITGFLHLLPNVLQEYVLRVSKRRVPANERDIQVRGRVAAEE